MPYIKPPLLTYYFQQQPDDRWKIYDDFCSGDKLLDATTFTDHIKPSLVRLGISVRNEIIYEPPKQRIDIPGFGIIHANIRIFVNDGKIVQVNLLTDDGSLIRGHIRQFKLILPNFDGTPWPYTQAEMEEEMD